jgi:hypothetical protein
MKGRIIIGLLFGTLSCTLAKAQIQEDLICLNTICFPKEESKQPSSTSPIEHHEQANPKTNYLPSLVPAAMEDSKSPETQQYLSSPAYSQNSNTSRYFSIVNEQLPFFEKRFMNVRAYDMNYGTNPEFENSRPKIAVNIFKRRNWDCARVDWEK